MRLLDALKFGKKSFHLREKRKLLCIKRKEKGVFILFFFFFPTIFIHIKINLYFLKIYHKESSSLQQYMYIYIYISEGKFISQDGAATSGGGGGGATAGAAGGIGLFPACASPTLLSCICICASVGCASVGCALSAPANKLVTQLVTWVK